MADERTQAQRVRDLYQDHIGFWKTYRDAMDNEENFLAGERYEDDHGSYNRDRRLTQIRGQEIQDTIRHVVAKVTERPRSVEARPIDEDQDPDTAEVAASLIEWELSNPWKGFEDCFEAAVTACREKRLGIVWMDWEPSCGAFGEILYRYADGRRFMWDEAYDPHHPLCGWLLEERRLPVEWIKQNFKDADWVQADRDAFTESGEFKPGIPILRGAGGERLPRSGTFKDGRATLWFCWYKRDPEYGGVVKQATEYQALPKEGDRFMACVSGCGYRSQTQDELQAAGTEALPSMLEQGCPTCGGDLERVDAIAPELAAPIPPGRKLVILAPFSPAPDDRTLYEGDWPIATARSFPGLFLTAYIKPGLPMGPSDTALMWDQQVACDQLRTMGLQRVFEHRNYWEMPWVGIKDYKGQRFNFREDQFNVMYRDNSVAMGPSDVRLHSGTGLDPAWSLVFGISQAALTQYRGVTDLGLTQESTKNIAASTVAQLNQMGEIPTAHFNRRKNRELGKFYGVVWDYIRATYTAERLKRLRIDGSDLLMPLAGDEMPNFDFVIADTPEYTGLEKARADAFQLLLQIALNPQTAPFLDLFAELNNLPRSIVRKLEKRMKEQQAEAEAMPPTGPNPEDQLAELAGLAGPPGQAASETGGP